MGDRRNIELCYRSDNQQDSRVYLYTHWEGGNLHYILADALNSPEGRNRWDDPDYLARIIFEHMISKSDNKETGFGIAPYQMDYNHPNIVVDLVRKTVNGMTYELFIEEYGSVGATKEGGS